jgi:Secretion system C-terminal sorting domain/Beta-propeller repeat
MIFILRSTIIIQTFLIILTFEINAQDFKWVKGISSSTGQINSWNISIDRDGNSYIAGFFFGTATFDAIQITSYGGADIFVAKYDPDGNCLWAKHAGSPSNNHSDDYGMSISVDAKGNSYVTGFFYETALFDTIQVTAYNGPYSNNSDIFLAKYDSKGNVVWVKQAGGIGGDVGLYIKVDNNGNSYLVGQMDDSAKFGSIQLKSYGSTDVFIAKYDPDGNCLWANHAGGDNSDEIWGIAVDSNGNSYVTGFIWSATARFDTIQLKNYANSNHWAQTFIAKYDINGNCLWAKQPVGYSGDQGYGISIDANGNSYVTGTFQGSIAFDTTNLTSYGDWDMFLTKYDTKGNVIWAKQAGGGSTDLGGNVSVDSKSNSYITGHFSDTAAFGSFHIISRGGYDMFVAKYDRNGNCIWVQQAGGEYTDDGHGVSVDANGNCYITGIYTGTATFGPFQLSATQWGAFIAKIPSSTLAVKNEIDVIPKEYSLQQNYPNPFNPNTVISYSLPLASNVKLIVYNSIGQTVKVLENEYKNVGNYSVNFNASALPSGIYFYKLEVGQFTKVKKMILLK